ncbi:ATP-dependent helicase [Williamsia phyllosphaerae]|uniref:DNA 3'-5' helicase n=1 Tax=Williamsia phyllosphaerae TaxID=885042 RepID=A0ABQ1UU94_9NOCA|nr:ATP-dependent DNA helicase [Williamsia phyllosphaerae]GGF25724.1 DNA helicase [Williamsia phyllosphaerae]
MTQPSRGSSPRRVEVRATLVAPPRPTSTAHEWNPDAAALIAGTAPIEADERSGWHPFRVTGGPGTGKTALLTDIAVARLTDPDTDPESVLVLAANRRAASRLREQISARVLDASSDRSDLRRSTREPLVRTVHSYAFAVLRLQAAAHGNPPPRLITGSEQDAVLRELLAGDIDDGARHWPERLRPALSTDGFAQALRDLMMRAAERGIGPEGLIALGREHRREEWVAAGIAYRQYEQSMLLRGAVGVEAPQASAPAVDAAELIGSALTALSGDAVLLDRERARIRHLLVDDAHHLDPHAAALVRLVGTGTEVTVIAGDGDQSIYGFRGASSRFLDTLVPAGGDHDVVLELNHRSAHGVAAVGAGIAARLPGARVHPPTRGVRSDTETGGRSAVTVTSYSSAAKEATAVADALRRAHLFDGVAWSDMAVVVRSVPRAIAPLRRALRSAGVPVVTPATEMPLHRQRAVAALMTVLRAVDHPLDAEEIVELLTGPVGGADPTALRRLRRGVRRVDTEMRDADAPQRDSLDIVVDLAASDRASAQPHLDALTATERGSLERVLDVLDAARTAALRGGGVEDVLWSAWQATGLSRRWSATALRGGPGADQSDRDLDAVVALFDVAASFTDNLPAATLGAFVEHVGKLQIPGEAPRRSAISDAVTIVSAHASAGREWEVVAVAGVLDGLWPSLRSRGSILATQQLVDLLDGVAAEGIDTVSRSAVALAEERRLFLVACSRARRQLLVSAVDDGSGDSAPSRFVVELAAALGADPDATDAPPVSADELLPVAPAVQRILSLPSLVATLRAQVCGPDPHPAAAELLARLADAGVPGAHPHDWYGLPETSSEVSLWTPERGPVTLSPSNIEALQRCSLRWMLERNGGRDGDKVPAVAGTLVHTLVQAVAGEIDPADVTGALRRVWDQVDVGADWFSAHELDRTEAMLTHFADWLTHSRADLDEIGVEVDVDAVLPPAAVDPDTDPADDPVAGVPIRLRGRIDRLERDHAGRPVVVDVKTTKTAATAADAEVHPQLATYQLALHLGGVPEVGSAEPGGGQLVYVNTASKKTGAAVRTQSPLTPDQVQEWIEVVRSAARASIGPRFVATINPGCGHCGLAASCPATLRGKAVTDD